MNNRVKYCLFPYNLNTGKADENVRLKVPAEKIKRLKRKFVEKLQLKYNNDADFVVYDYPNSLIDNKQSFDIVAAWAKTSCPNAEVCNIKQFEQILHEKWSLINNEKSKYEYVDIADKIVG